MPRGLLVGMIGLTCLCGCTWPPPAKPAGPLAARDVYRDTEQAKALNAKAAAALRAGRNGEAGELLAKALQADPLFGPAHNNLGKVHYHQGKFYDAAGEFQQASKLMPKRPEPISNLGLVMEAVAQALAGEARNTKLDEAIATYGRAVEMAPNSAEYVGNLARARIHRGLRDLETRNLLQRLVKIDPRPEWVSWAQQELAGTKPPAPPPGGKQPLSRTP